MVTQPKGHVNKRIDTHGVFSRLKARVPFFREKLRIVEPVSGSFLKVCCTTLSGLLICTLEQHRKPILMFKAVAGCLDGVPVYSIFPLCSNRLNCFWVLDYRRFRWDNWDYRLVWRHDR